MDKLDRTILDQLARVPAGEKVPLAAIARAADASQSVIASIMERLIREGAIDKATLRPATRAPLSDAGTDPLEWLYVGLPKIELAQRIVAEAARRGVTQTVASVELFGGPTRLAMLKAQPGRIRHATVIKARKWFLESPAGMEARVDEASGGASPADEEGAGCSDRPAPDLPERPTGQQLHDALLAAARASDLSQRTFLAPLWNLPKNGMEQLRATEWPKPATVARIRAFLAGEPIEPPAKKEAHPNQLVRRTEREAAGLPPSERELAEKRSLTLSAAAEADRQAKIETAERAALRRLPGETLQDAVKREAREKGERRASARSTGTVSHPLTIADEVEAAEADAAIGAVTADRRAREARELTTASALIRKAAAEWPDQCARVARLACEMGVGVGEAWRRVIGAGIDCLDEAEAGA